MFTQLEQAKQKWGGSSDIIDRWLASRRQLLVSYWALATNAPSGRATLPEAERVAEFSDLLMDYVSVGHFEVYERIVSGCERHGGNCLAQTQRLYPRIAETTQQVLRFNDRYAELQSDDSLLELDADLSKLGEALEQRFELEDKLIASLHQHQHTST